MALSKLFNFFDLSFIHYQQGDPGFVNPYAYAYGYIGNMKYTAVAQGVRRQLNLSLPWLLTKRCPLL